MSNELRHAFELPSTVCHRKVKTRFEGARADGASVPQASTRERAGRRTAVDAVVRSTIEERSAAVAKAAAALRDKTSAHAYLCRLANAKEEPTEVDEEVIEVEEGTEDGTMVKIVDGADGADASESCGEASMTCGTDNAVAADAGDGEEQTCPICLDVRSALLSWSITICGHEGCYECMQQAVESTGCCPCCKRSLASNLLYEVDTLPAAPSSAPASDESDASSEYGSKLCALLDVVGSLQRQGEKCVIFSAWTRLLALANDALVAHGIVVASLVGSPTVKREAIARFSEDATVLLVPLFGGASGAGGGGAAGLTLTQASTAVLLEPALQPGIERQAAGRISRIGQTKQAKVIRLIVSDTIESRIVEWQEVRMQEGVGSTNSASLSLNDFVQLLQ